MILFSLIIHCDSRFSDENSTSLSSCFVCPEGHACFGGETTECQPGSYAQSGASFCRPCPVGYQCPLSGNSVPEICEEGKYSLGEADKCLDCPPGSACSRGQIIACQLGTYSLGQESSCTSCPSKFYCPETNSTGVPCLPSFYCGVGSSKPAPCSDGEYSDGSQSSCTVCVEGYYCLAGVKQICPAGTYSQVGASKCKIW
jgi:hypothetical protein